ncbi:MAG: hypothetical protein ACPHN3_07930 [Spongiibacter sp.]
MTDVVMRKADLVYLVGPMGAGKSTIGRLLADSRRLDFGLRFASIVWSMSRVVNGWRQ